MTPIVSRYVNSGELNFRVEDKDAAISRALQCVPSFGKELSRCEIDGVRVEFAQGWFNLRKSNTEPYLRLIAEAKSEAMLADMLGLIKGAVCL